nr:DUF4279 domain-containing protein [Sessilibacter corallicola]
MQSVKVEIRNVNSRYSLGAIRCTAALALKENRVENNEGRVYFAFDGDDFNPQEITEFLGLEPTNIKRKGSKIPGKLPNMSSWELSTERIVKEHIDIFKMSAQIVSVLQPKLDLIIAAKTLFKVEPRFQIVLTFSGNEEHSTPAIGFEVETIEFLGAIGAFVDIDTYKH